MNKEQLKSRYDDANKRWNEERGEVRRAQQRRDYWDKVMRNLEERLGLVRDGQLEMETVDDDGRTCR